MNICATIRFLSLLLLSVFAGLLASTAHAEACNQESPEGVLRCYFAALEQGDAEAVLKVYWDTSKFYLPHPIKLNSFKVIEKKTIEQDLNVCEGVHPESCKETPLWAQADTIQFDVLEESESGESAMYSYWVRQIGGKWFLVGHSGWNAPE